MTDLKYASAKLLKGLGARSVGHDRYSIEAKVYSIAEIDELTNAIVAGAPWPRAIGAERKEQFSLENGEFSSVANNPGESDRIMAIVGAAHLEGVLEEIIAARLPVLDVDLRKKLFSALGGGILATFASRVHMARALGIVDGDAYEELKLIAKIRNAFAHQVGVASFDNPVVVKMTDGLKLYRRHVANRSESQPVREFDDSPRRQFGYAVHYLSHHLLWNAAKGEVFGGSIVQ